MGHFELGRISCLEVADQDQAALRSELRVSGTAPSCKQENIAVSSFLSQLFSLRTSRNNLCYSSVETTLCPPQAANFKAGKEQGKLQMIQKRFGVGK